MINKQALIGRYSLMDYLKEDKAINSVEEITLKFPRQSSIFVFILITFEVINDRIYRLFRQAKKNEVFLFALLYSFI